MSKIDPTVLVAIIAGFVTILGYFIARYFEKKKLFELQIREQKLPAYEEFVDFLFDIFKKHKAGNTLSAKDINELGDFYWQMNKKAILWLSDKTLKSYSIWKSMAGDYANKTDRGENENLKFLFALETLLMDFRNDIGHQNKKIEKGDILKIFLNNFDNYNNKNK